MVVFPGTVVPLTVRRESSLRLLDTSLPESKIIGLVTQRDSAKDDPVPEDLYGVGTAVTVLKLLRQPDETTVIIVQALKRIAVSKYVLTHPFLKAEVRALESTAPPSESKQWEAEIKTLRENAMKIIELSPDIPDQARAILAEEPGEVDGPAADVSPDFEALRAHDHEPAVTREHGLDVGRRVRRQRV
jgi:ATP-dependent Lon protease